MEKKGLKIFLKAAGILGLAGLFIVLLIFAFGLLLVFAGVSPAEG